MTLIELLVSVALASFLVLGLVQMVSAATAADILQRNQAQVLDRARFALRSLGRSVREAGFMPQPWDATQTLDALGPANRDGTSAAGDRLEVRSWSDRNCFGNRNPVLDAEGRPRFFIREQVFDVNAGGSLTLTCRFGPDPTSLVTQIRRQGLVPGVESFQLLYGEDADADGNIEGWVPAAAWADPRRVLGLRIGLLLAGDDEVIAGRTAEFDVLGDRVTAPADGHLRRLFDFAIAIRGRTG